METFVMKEFQRIFDNMLDIVLIVSETGEIIYCNQRALDFYGYSLEEMKRMNIFELRHGDQPEKVRGQLNRALTEGVEFEAIHRIRNGMLIPVYVRSVFLADSSNRYVISIVQDIREVRESYDKARLFDVSLDISEEALAVIDLNGKISLWNRAAERRFGYSRAEIIGKSIYQLVPADKMEEFECINQILLARTAIEGFETVRVHKDGTHLQVSVSGATIVDKDNETIGVLMIYRDNTLLRRLKQELYLTQERARIALEGGQFCIWIKDIGQDVFRIDEGLLRLAGYEDTLSDPRYYTLDLIHPMDREAVTEEYYQALIENRSMIMEYRILAASGSYLWIRSKGSIHLLDEKGNRKQIVGTHEDITDRKQIEERLKESNENMMLLADKAQRAEKARNIFLANMSHEIRTPLHGILTSIQLLEQKTKMDEEFRNLMKALKSSAELLNGNVAEIMDLSSVDQEEVRVLRTPFSMRLILQEAVNDLVLDVSSKGIEAGFFIDPEIPEYLLGDPQKIRQITTNLITNAVKFTDHGKVTLHARMLSKVGNKTEVEIEIADTGCGMEADELDSVFSPFYQSLSLKDGRNRGTSLELAIAVRYAQAMGGQLTGESKVGEGSSFCFRCKYEKYDLEAGKNKEVEAQAQELNETEYLPKATKRILSIDDSTMNQDLMGILLVKEGYAVDLAYSGAEAEERMQAGETYDLILMDIQLPDTSGLSLIEKWKEQQSFQNIPIIAMTAYGAYVDRDKCLEAGAMEYITKPIDIPYLLGKIHKIWNLQKKP